MSKYIDADALKEQVDAIWDNRAISLLGCRILTMIDNAPSIDIADGKRGEWIEKAISIIDDMQREGIITYEQACEYRMRARMKKE